MFSALLIDKDESGQTVSLTMLDEAQLPEGSVTVDVEYSTLNYKDALARSRCRTRSPLRAGSSTAPCAAASSSTSTADQERP